jgi:DNA-binding NtrC family response regulator
MRAISGVGGVVAGEYTDKELCQAFEKHGFITRSPVMLPILRQARKAALVSDITVLIEGETGTGKQVLARAIHSLDEKRCHFSFITVHCSTITESLCESELFGHQQGAFSGALRSREGLFQAANRGTLFLDDVNDLALALQPKLLDVLQRGILRRVGSDQEAAVDVRIIAAANQPLAQMVEQNRFRQDLYHRLNVVRLHLPALSERDGDLEALILELTRRHGNLYPAITQIDSDLIHFLKSWPFRGNVRELEHAVQRMLFLKTEGSSLQMSDWLRQIPDANVPADGEGVVSEAAHKLWSAICEHGLPYRETIQLLERKILEKAVQSDSGTRRDIAKRLHTSERTLYEKLRTHRLSRHTVAG